LIAALQGAGDFDGRLAGTHELIQAQAAFRRVGVQLDDDGTLRPLSMEGLEGRDLTSALRTYVDRVRRGYADPALVVGTGKDLVEATARHAVVERGGAVDERMGFPGTLYQAFYLLGLPAASKAQIDALYAEPDPATRFAQALYLVAIAANALRNAEGAGHGRPWPSTVGDLTAGALAEAMASVAAILLDNLVQDGGDRAAA
jgi:hypothetical protein